MAAIAALAAPPAEAQTYPDKPIHLIVPFTPGSATDVIARALAQALSTKLGQTVIVENKPGAGGTIGAAQVAKAAPDGYTLLVNSSAHTVNPSIYPNLTYDTAKDLIGVSLLAQLPNIMVAAPSRGWKTVDDLVKEAKDQPGKINYASAGIGSGTHMNAEKFKLAAGIDGPHVPYHGTPEALADTMGGRIDYFFSPVIAALCLVRDGRVVALAIGRPKRSSVLPDVPTTEEAGFKGSAYNFWVGLLAPAGTPPAVIAKLNAEVKSRPELARGQGAAGRARRRRLADHAGRLRQDGRARAQGKRRAREGGRHQAPVAADRGADMAETLLQTTVVGSYPQPDWLVNRAMLSKVVPRTRLKEIWRVAEPFLEQAQDDATLLAIRDMERAGIDIITDGEMRRESYSNRFATALDGIDDEHPGELVNTGRKTPVPRVVGKIRRTGPVELRDMQFLRANTERRPRSPCPAPSPWASRSRTSSTRTPRRCAWTTPRR